MSNKRRDKRYIKRCEVEFSIDESVYRGISSDFSLKGMYVRTNNPVKSGVVMGLVIFYPDGKRSKLTVQVKRASRTSISRTAGTPAGEIKNGMGVEIIERDANYLNFIRSLIPEQQKQ